MSISHTTAGISQVTLRERCPLFAFGYSYDSSAFTCRKGSLIRSTTLSQNFGTPNPPIPAGLCAYVKRVLYLHIVQVVQRLVDSKGSGAEALSSIPSSFVFLLVHAGQITAWKRKFAVPWVLLSQATAPQISSDPLRSLENSLSKYSWCG